MPDSSASVFSQSPYIRCKSTLSDSRLRSIDTYLQELMQQDSSRLRKTHYFHGRHENIYIDSPSASGNEDLDFLIDESLTLCAELLGMNKQQLKIGYWFNLMEPGQLTTLHRHDDYDELMSGVVYLLVPEDSGDLILQVNGNEVSLSPVSGNFIYFSPKTPHRVSINRSNSRRLSIGMNVGPVDDPADEQ